MTSSTALRRHRRGERHVFVADATREDNDRIVKYPSTASRQNLVTTDRARRVQLTHGSPWIRRAACSLPTAPQSHPDFDQNGKFLANGSNSAADGVYIPTTYLRRRLAIERQVNAPFRQASASAASRTQGDRFISNPDPTRKCRRRHRRQDDVFGGFTRHDVKKFVKTDCRGARAG